MDFGRLDQTIKWMNRLQITIVAVFYTLCGVGFSELKIVEPQPHDVVMNELIRLFENDKTTIQEVVSYCLKRRIPIRTLRFVTGTKMLDICNNKGESIIAIYIKKNPMDNSKQPYYGNIRFTINPALRLPHNTPVSVVEKKLKELKDVKITQYVAGEVIKTEVGYELEILSKRVR